MSTEIKVFAFALACWLGLTTSAVMADPTATQIQTEIEQLQTRRESPHNLLQLLSRLTTEYMSRARQEDDAVLLHPAVSVLEELYGPDHTFLAIALICLAEAHASQGRYGEAVDAYRRAVHVLEKSAGTNLPTLGVSLLRLGNLYERRGDHSEAEARIKRAVSIFETAPGVDNYLLRGGLAGLVNFYTAQGRHGEAAPFILRKVKIDEVTFGANSPEVYGGLGRLGSIYFDQDRHVESEEFFRRALEIQERISGKDHINLTANLNGLCMLYIRKSSYAQAEEVCRRSLNIREKELGLEHPIVATGLNNLARVYSDQGRHHESEKLQTRALAIWEKTFGPNDPTVANALSNLALTYKDQRRFTEAEMLQRRALMIFEQRKRPDDLDVAQSLNNLAVTYFERGRRSAEIEELHQKALAIREKALGPDSYEVAESLRNLGDIRLIDRRYAEAAAIFLRTLAIVEKVFGPAHPKVANTLDILSFSIERQGRYQEALVYSRRVSEIYRNRISQSSERQAEGERRTNKDAFWSHLRLLGTAGGQTLSRPGESFELVQLMRASKVGIAVSMSMARFSAPSDELTEVVRREQDARARYRRLDEEFVKALGASSGARNPEKEDRIRAEINQLDEEIQRLGKVLAARFPDYAALVSTEPMPLEDTQRLLRPDEAMLVYALDGDRAYLWVVRPDKAEFLPLAVKPSKIAMLANRVRTSLVADNPLITPFDATAAYELYRELFAPALPHLDGVTDILVVSSDPLSGLPLGVLLGSPPKVGKLKLEDHRDLDWLIKRYRFATLPAVISLKALRKHGKTRLADQLPFFGIGDPVLEGDAGETRAGKSASGTGLFPRRGSVANVDALRKLPSLPDTTDELKAIATALGADPGALYLRQRATESNAKAQPLGRYRVLAFATHGLLSGEATDLAEPGLVLTPPPQGTIDDDGYLGASEVAQLKLNADWVVLSACNTAASDGTPGAEGLTGLAKAFFYAGARALLVSHWPVISSATTKLVTDTFQQHAKNPEQGKSGALQKAMLDMMNDANRPEQAHPAFWAPFVVVGDGR